MANKKAQKLHRIATLEQWVEIRVHEGETVTTLHPSKEELLEQLAEMATPPDLVYRRLNFREGVPAEYFWSTNDPVQRQWGGHCIQRMTVERWRLTMACEALNGDGHVGPSGEAMPQPQERGGCDCASCVASQARLDGEAVGIHNAAEGGDTVDGKCRSLQKR